MDLPKLNSQENITTSLFCKQNLRENKDHPERWICELLTALRIQQAALFATERGLQPQYYTESVVGLPLSGNEDRQQINELIALPSRQRPEPAIALRPACSADSYSPSGKRGGGPAARPYSRVLTPEYLAAGH